MPIDWIWPAHIARGKITLIQGRPDLGKSLVTLDVAARVSTAATWPDGTPGLVEPGNVLIYSGEDTLEDTIVPRLIAAGADLSRVRVVPMGSLQLDEGGLTAVEQTLAMRHTALFIVDPLAACVGRIDTHRNAEVRRLMGDLSAIATRQQVGILALAHLNKQGGARAIDRSQGSIAFNAHARFVLQIGPDPADDPDGSDPEGRRLLVPVKVNVARRPPGLAYRAHAVPVALADGESTLVPRLLWDDDPVTISADQLAEAAPDRHGRPPTARLTATAFLQERLADGPQQALGLKADAHLAGIKVRTLDQAKKSLGVVSTRSGEHWLWALPT
jgi:hypothetical protein